jgi:hypothetical protein
MRNCLGAPMLASWSYSEHMCVLATNDRTNAREKLRDSLAVSMLCLVMDCFNGLKNNIFLKKERG